MKKLLSIYLCLIFVFALCGCGGNNEKKIEKHNIDVEYYAKLGKLSDADYALGDEVEGVKKKLQESSSDDEEDISYSEYSMGENTILSDGEYCCVYPTSEEQNGISYVIKFGGSYGFEQGAVSTFVKEKMTSIGFEANERGAESGELFFIPISSGTPTVLQYDFGENTVLFVFEQNALCATVIKK